MHQSGFQRFECKLAKERGDEVKRKHMRTKRKNCHCHSYIKYLRTRSVDSYRLKDGSVSSMGDNGTHVMTTGRTLATWSATATRTRTTRTRMQSRRTSTTGRRCAAHCAGGDVLDGGCGGGGRQRARQAPDGGA